MKTELEIVWLYIRAVIRQWWWVVVIEGLLALTDVFERIFGTWLLPPTRVKVGIGLATLAVAQYRVYREILIQLRSRREKKTNLVIYPEGRSVLYVEVPAGAAVIGAYLEIRLVVQNNGEQNSVIRRFDFEIAETGRRHENQEPLRRNCVQTRQAQQMMQNNWILTQERSIIVDAHNIRSGILPFYINGGVGDLPAQVQCKLRLEDTEGASAEFTFPVHVVG